MIARLALCLIALFPLAVFAGERVCAPTSMVKIVTAFDVPGAAKDDFRRVPKTLHRYGDRHGRVEEARNPSTGLQLLVVVSEPHIWIADLSSRGGNYQRDPGPTFFFRAKVFGNPDIKSTFINSLELGCEVAWLTEAGATKSRVTHSELGSVERLQYTEGTESLALLIKAGIPARLELHRSGKLYVAVRYVEYSSGLPFDASLFRRPDRISFDNEEKK